MRVWIIMARSVNKVFDSKEKAMTEIATPARDGISSGN